MQDRVKRIVSKLLAYCRTNGWAGYDPYDALNSRVFSACPFLDFKLSRLVLTQMLKRSPMNLRPILGVPRTQNPKALALFLSAFLRISEAELPDRGALVSSMISRLHDLRSSGTAYSCWGYSFPWQTRGELVPSGSPNLVCTTFVANALLDAFDYSGDSRCLTMAESAADYIFYELYWTDGKSIHSFSYPLKSIRSQVHNANLLAASLFCRISKLTGKERYLDTGMAVARCSVSKQEENGSWNYGESPTQGWIDNFHTGFNLIALKAIANFAETSEFDTAIQSGVEFYQTQFFRIDGAPKYFNNSLYPIDIHCAAQGIITLNEFRSLDTSGQNWAFKVLRWTLDNMWDDDVGFFYYRMLRFVTIRTPYMRWSQAWMLLALATILPALHERSNLPKRDCIRSS